MLWAYDTPLSHESEMIKSKMSSNVTLFLWISQKKTFCCVMTTSLHCHFQLKSNLSLLQQPNLYLPDMKDSILYIELENLWRFLIQSYWLMILNTFFVHWSNFILDHLGKCTSILSESKYLIKSENWFTVSISSFHYFIILWVISNNII